MNENEEPKKLGLFDVLGMIEGQQLPWNELSEEFQKLYSPYMINRFISSKEQYAPIISKIDTLKLTPEQHYTLLCQIVDNRKRHYFDYKAYKKQKVEKDENLLIYACCHEYEIGAREAKTYINTMNDTVKEQLKTKWKDHYDIYGEK